MKKTVDQILKLLDKKYGYWQLFHNRNTREYKGYEFRSDHEPWVKGSTIQEVLEKALNQNKEVLNV